MAGYGQDAFYIIVVDISLVSNAFSSLRQLLLFSERDDSVMITVHSTRGCSIAVGS
jgi:hypothetical protein